jgi:hypothetical protein
MTVVQTPQKADIPQSIFNPFIVFIDKVEAAYLFLFASESIL